jgi:hypothetical protein
MERRKLSALPGPLKPGGKVSIAAGYRGMTATRTDEWQRGEDHDQAKESMTGYSKGSIEVNARDNLGVRVGK